ncbi:hypothetical protein GGP41_006557 [Bipolaris sorokiniana]|uniref:Uncharacterized protein n=1 Tax=Cochliobolus sativus TaxID=45130 RepID=A0A8H5ZRA6_COCSA|nr:hypothetical protein GGP41_006557 [Bipolaris sorokiniana]
MCLVVGSGILVPPLNIPHQVYTTMILAFLSFLLPSTRIHKVLFSLSYPSNHSFRRRRKSINQTPPMPHRANHLNKHTLMWFYRRSGHITHRPILCHERDLVNQLGFARGTFHGKCDDDGDADLEGVDIR